MATDTYQLSPVCSVLQKKNKYQNSTPESSQTPPVEATSITTFCSLLLSTYGAHLYGNHQVQFAWCLYPKTLLLSHLSGIHCCFHAIYLSKMLSIRGVCLEYDERKKNK